MTVFAPLQDRFLAHYLRRGAAADATTPRLRRRRRVVKRRDVSADDGSACIEFASWQIISRFSAQEADSISRGGCSRIIGAPLATTLISKRGGRHACRYHARIQFPMRGHSSYVRGGRD